MISEPKELGIPKNVPRNLSFQKNQSEQVSSDLPYGKKMRINTRTSMTSLKKKENWFPISPQNAQWNVIKEYNEKHKDQQIELTAAESFKVADAYAGFLKDVTMPSLTSNFPLKKLSQIKMVLTTNMRTN